MSVKAFGDLYDDELNWKWDESDQVFRATDDMMKMYILKPTHGILEVEEELKEEEDQDDD